MSRCYVFVHRKLSGINAGIQALHAVARLSQLTHEDGEFATWAQDHETVVLLDGGHCTDLEDVHQSLKNHCIPVAAFEEVDFNNQITAVAVIADVDTMNAIEYLKSMEGRRLGGDYMMYNGKVDLAEYLMSFRTHRG